VGVVYLALAVACYWHMWSGGVRHWSFPDGDQYLNMWNLDWFAFALAHGHNPFFSGWINFPHGVNLLTNTGEPLLGLLATPVTLLWGPVAAFDVMMTLALAASAGAGYVFVRHFVRATPIAFVGGLVYGFGAYAIAQGDAHLNLVFIALPPLVLLQLWRVLSGEARPVAGGVLLGVLVVGQFFVSTELLADTAVIAVFGAVLVAVVFRRHLAARWRPAGLGVGCGAAVAVVVLAYPVWFALRGPGSIIGPVQLAPQSYRADLLGAVVPSVFQAIAPHAALHLSSGFAGNAVENGSYLGIPLLLVLAAGMVLLWRRPVTWVTGSLGVTAFVLSLGDHLVIRADPATGHAGGVVLPGWLLFHLPLYSNAVPVRFAFLVDLFAALGICLLLEEVRRRVAPTPWTALAPAGVAALVLAPLAPAIPYAGVADIRPPVVFDALSAVPTGSPAVVYPYADNGNAMAMLWQAWTFMRFKMPGGNHLVPGPSGRESLSPVLGSALPTATGLALAPLALGQLPPETTATKAAIESELTRWRVAYVVASPATAVNPVQATAFLTWLLGPPTSESGGGMLWRLR